MVVGGGGEKKRGDQVEMIERFHQAAIYQRQAGEVYLAQWEAMLGSATQRNQNNKSNLISNSFNIQKSLSFKYKLHNISKFGSVYGGLR